MKRKTRNHLPKPRRIRFGLPVPLMVGAALVAGLPAHGEDEEATAATDGDSSESVEDDEEARLEQAKADFEGGAESYANWVEFSAGGLFESGSRPQAERSAQRTASGYGGISDLHYQYETEDFTVFSVDGRAMVDQNNYDLILGLEKEEVYFMRLKYRNDRTWYNGNGGYFPPANQFYPLRDDALALDRGELSFEAGLSLEDKPSFSFGYFHLTREGNKSSTIWGQTHPDFSTVTRGLSPSYYDLDETRDIFTLDAKHHIKETEFGLGVRYEIGDLDNQRKTTQWPNEPAIERKITQKDDSSYDLFNVHAFTETWIKPELMFSTGFLFANLEDDFGGSRIYGSDFDVSYTPDPLNGAGYIDLDGSSTRHQYVMNLNLLFLPMENLSIVPSLRVQRDDWDADSSTLPTQGATLSAPTRSEADGDLLDVRQRLDVRYTGFTNWVLFVRGELTEGQGSLRERGGIYLGSPVQRNTDDDRFFQKYSAGVRWYPVRRVTLDLGGYFKRHNYDYDHGFDNTPNGSGNRYPAYLTMQAFDTWDGNIRVTLRPWSGLSLISRYDYQYSTIDTRPDSASGLGEMETSQLNSHVVGQSVSWSPWSRMYLQAGFNYVLSETKTPASSFSQSVLVAQNNYWTLDVSPHFVLNDKTDLGLGYVYYRADNYNDNSDFGVPLGSGATEHIASAVLTRRITERMRVSLRYAYFNYEDDLSGGHNDFEAHSIYSSLQYRF